MNVQVVDGRGDTRNGLVHRRGQVRNQAAPFGWIAMISAAQRGGKRLGGEGLAAAALDAPSLRRTYISIALLANNFDAKWVMVRLVMQA